MADEENKKPAKPATFSNLTALAQALDSEQAHTSFGKLPLSVEKSANCYSFPQAKKEDQGKIYVAELTNTENIGKNSPGFYQYQDQIKYANDPKFAFGQAPRMDVQKPKYDFYENALFLDDPINADLNRKARTCAPKIGTEPRFNPNNLEQNPGPQYLPKDKPELRRAAAYTLGVRRAGGGLMNQTSTPASVGPARYAPEHAANPSTKKNVPRWTLPKAGRLEAEVKKFDKHQTYDTRSGFGGQQISKNKTS